MATKFTYKMRSGGKLDVVSGISPPKKFLKKNYFLRQLEKVPTNGAEVGMTES